MIITRYGGHHEIWRGYEPHIEVADGDIPVSGVSSSAHLHDSQVAVSLATSTASRVTSLYDLMDSAYDAALIPDHSRRAPHAVCCVGWAAASAMCR